MISGIRHNILVLSLDSVPVYHDPYHRGPAQEDKILHVIQHTEIVQQATG